MPLDDVNFFSDENLKIIKRRAFALKWNEFYDFIQFLADFSKETKKFPGMSEVRRQGEAFIKICNQVMETERAGYRFVSGDLCEITDECEIREIELACASSDAFEPARVHLRSALSLYADRDTPDYRNAIKEAISSVESAFFIINGEKSNNLAKAISLAEKKGVNLHPALREGILKIYGWTSDEQGVRHALFDGDASIGEAHARFMIVTCSALINFLKTCK
jgi:hypothetical protein